MQNPAPHAHTAGVARTRAELGDLRPDLLERYDAAVPAARAAVLSRLLGALDREPLPGITGRRRDTAAGTERVTFTGRREIRFPTPAGAAFAAPAPGLAAVTGDARIDDPAALARVLWPDSTLPAELDNSVANLAHARAAAAPDPAGDPDG